MVKPKKYLGQHFLKDLSVAKNIADCISLNADGLVEVGPGTGALTQFLLQKNIPLYGFEVDIESIDFLQNHFSDPHLHLFHQDFLIASLSEFKDKEWVVCGNFPYNISSQIIFKILENKEKFPQMVGMFQKEVAERICSAHGNKTYGIISVITQAYYETEYLFTVDKNVFHPPPKVQSGVIRLNRKENPPIKNTELFTQIVKMGFNQRRKKLSNALKTLNIPVPLQGKKFLDLRAEQLSVEEFIDLSNQWDEQRS